MPVSHGSTCHVPGNIRKQGEACSWKGLQNTSQTESVSSSKGRHRGLPCSSVPGTMPRSQP